MNNLAIINVPQNSKNEKTLTQELLDIVALSPAMYFHLNRPDIKPENISWDELDAAADARES
jgi:hypothetical protein